jgi:hypothetical protein
LKTGEASVSSMYIETPSMQHSGFIKSKTGEASLCLIFTAEAVGVFSYFSCFPNDVGTVGMVVSCDLCSVKVNAKFSCCRVFGYH